MTKVQSITRSALARPAKNTQAALALPCHGKACVLQLTPQGRAVVEALRSAPTAPVKVASRLPLRITGPVPSAGRRMPETGLLWRAQAVVMVALSSRNMPRAPPVYPLPLTCKADSQLLIRRPDRRTCRWACRPSRHRSWPKCNSHPLRKKAMACLTLKARCKCSRLQ